MRFTIYQESRVGRRQNNQDRIAYCYSSDALLMVVADGMGGHLHGEVAAQIAVQFVTQAFQREAHPGLADPSAFLSRAIGNAHRAIVDYAREKGLPEAPRTTLVACVVQGGCPYWAHAGDSRLYLLRRDRVLAQTRDHSRVQLMLEQGLLDAAGAARHPARNRIYSCLGGTQLPQVDYARGGPLRDGDVLALCSDGVWGPLGSDALCRGLLGANVMEAVPRLMDRAEALGGPTCDNLSLIALCWHDTSGRGGPHTVSTEAQDDFTTRLESFENTLVPGHSYDLTEDEIERAIAEINAAIHKFSR